MQSSKHGRVIWKSYIFCFDLEVDHVRDIFGSIHLDVVPDIRFIGYCFDLFPYVLLYTIEHLSFIGFIHFFHEFHLVTSHHFELLDLVFPDDLLEGVEVEVETMGKVKA